MVDSFLEGRQSTERKYTVVEALHMFDVSKSGYYAWKHRHMEEDTQRREKAEALKGLKGKFRAIIHKLGFVPGKRTFRLHLWRDYGLNVSIKRCRRIMGEMKLAAKRPKKDAYKHQATHGHECASPANIVNQEFYIGPRKVILTDITYLYYGMARTPIYLCAFKDAFTREVLGYALSLRMDVGLVRAAYGRMKEKHGGQLQKSDCIIHSDQGSQYLSTDFQKILGDDGFIQSVSARGNSQDNAPMESFFGRMKTEVLDLIALCPDAATVVGMVDGYMKMYNEGRYVYALAGLAPTEFYAYATTGIYPLDNYFGVKSSVLLPVGKLVERRLELAAEKEKKVRDSYAKSKEKALQLRKTPEQIIHRDQIILDHEISKWRTSAQQATEQVSHLKDILNRTKSAMKYVLALSAEMIMELKEPLNWQEHPELNYIFDMKQLF